MEYTIEEIHDQILIILDEFLRICEKYNLNYYMIGGTFLGAVRHKGFIPWDDDMDIAMPRKDYDKFLKIANEELPKNMKLRTFQEENDRLVYLPKLVNFDIKIKSLRSGKAVPLFIDVFPIDGVPNNVLLRYIYYFRILFNRMLISYYNIDVINKKRKRKKYEKVLISIGKILPTKKIIKPKKILYKIDVLLKKNGYDDCNMIGTIMGAYRTREIVPKDYFGKPIKYEFEGRLLNGPEKFDKYLSHIYGDYMIPPMDKYTNQHMLYKK